MFTAKETRAQMVHESPELAGGVAQCNSSFHPARKEANSGLELCDDHLSKC